MQRNSTFVNRDDTPSRHQNEAFEVYKLARQLWRNEPRVRELQDLFVR
jgi:hypothetical protein